MFDLTKQDYNWNTHLVGDTDVKAVVILYTDKEPLDVQNHLPEADFHLNFTDTRHEQQAWDDFENIMSTTDKLQVFTSRHAFMLNSDIRPDIMWVYQNGKYYRLSDCTARMLRYGHNLQKMYIAGEFKLET